jgi:hypothetical protein
MRLRTWLAVAALCCGTARAQDFDSCLKELRGDATANGIATDSSLRASTHIR